MSVEVAHLVGDGAHQVGLVRREVREGLGSFGVLDLGGWLVGGCEMN